MTYEADDVTPMFNPFNRGSLIKVIGVGGGGGNAVEHMVLSGVQGVEIIAANTDAQALTRSSAHRVIQLGRNGLGAGGRPDAGRAAAEEAEDQIREAIEGANMLFITAGMGGGTGTGAAPVIARIAKSMGILTVGVVTKPFEFEGSRRMKAADAGLQELGGNVDSLIVVLNDKLLEVKGDDCTQDECFAEANDVLRNAVGGISDVIHVPGLVNVDFEDVKSVMSEPGKARMGTALASGPARASKAAEAAVACPLLEGTDLAGAKGILVLIAASRSTFKLSESRDAMNIIRRYGAEDANVIFGTAYDDSLGDQLRITVIATGLADVDRTQVHAPAYAAAPVQQPYQSFTSGPTTPAGSERRMVRPGVPGLTPPPMVPQAPAQPPQQAFRQPAARPVPPAQPSAPATPSVWRSGRQQASVVGDPAALSASSDIDMPAFLRKAAR